MIVQNAACCLTCGDFIVSKHRHDFVTCTCGAMSVDGGQEYLRRVGDFSNVVEMSWSIPNDVYQACADAVQEAIDTNRNKFGIANAVMRKLREYDRIIAMDEMRVMAENKDLDEIMVVDVDGAVSRYKRVHDDS